VGVAAAFLLASFVKGTTGLGFPLIATPMVALVVDLKTTYALLVLPNIVMDILQVLRREAPWALWRRLAPFFAASVIGVYLGTQVFLAVPARVIYLCLAAMIGLFLVSSWLQIRLRISPAQEVWLGPLIGFAGGFLNGVANISGPPTAIYLLSLDLEKREFVKAVSSIFLIMKVSQMAAITQGGMLTGPILLASLGLTVLAQGGFWLGVHAQDRIPQRAFIRSLHGLLAAMAAYFVCRAF
jgi:hypothetical protein